MARPWVKVGNILIVCWIIVGHLARVIGPILEERTSMVFKEGHDIPNWQVMPDIEMGP